MTFHHSLLVRTEPKQQRIADRTMHVVIMQRRVLIAPGLGDTCHRRPHTAARVEHLLQIRLAADRGRFLRAVITPSW
jgi:hypothetical protein